MPLHSQSWHPRLSWKCTPPNGHLYARDIMCSWSPPPEPGQFTQVKGELHAAVHALQVAAPRTVLSFNNAKSADPDASTPISGRAVPRKVDWLRERCVRCWRARRCGCHFCPWTLGGLRLLAKQPRADQKTEESGAAARGSHSRTPPRARARTHTHTTRAATSDVPRPRGAPSRVSRFSASFTVPVV